MWKIVDKPKIVKVTKSLAARFAQMEGCPNDRVLREGQLRFIRDIFEARTFRTCEWSTAFCQETDKTYRVNGKHTSTVLASMEAIPDGVSVILSHYEVQDLAELAKLYATFDSQESAKKSNDINWLVAGVDPVLRELPKNIINMAVTSLAFEKWEMRAWSHKTMERAMLVLDDVDFCVFLAELMVGDCGHIRRGPVGAAMVRTFRKSKSAALEFWKLVRDETSNTPDVPDRKLAKWLNRVRINLGANTRKQTGVPIVSFHEVVYRSVQYFNYWRTGQPVDKMPPYFSDKPIPKVA